jgi:hypothetical protein
VTLRKKVATQAIGDLAGIDLVVLLFGRCNRPQHQRMSYLDLFRMRKQVIVDPAGEDRCLMAMVRGWGSVLIQPSNSRRVAPTLPSRCTWPLASFTQ